jgi:hypothetical protein
MGTQKVRYNHNLLFIVMLVVGSCIEPYEPSVTKQITNYLVVDAAINSTDGSATVTLTRTLPLYTPDDAPRELKAVVTIEDEQGTSYPLTEAGNGFYEQGNLPIDIQKQYRLHIRTADNQEYLSEFVPVKNSPPIDSVFWLPESDGTRIFVNTHDDSGKTRYYKWSYKETWEYRSVFSSLLKLVDGEVVMRPSSEYLDLCWSENISKNILVGSTSKLQQDVVSHFPLVFIPRVTNKLTRKYSIIVHQQAITEEAYQYWLQLQQTTESLGSLFDPMPSEINGNIYNASNPSEPVLGYFSAGSTEEHRIFISSSDLPEHLRFFPRSSCEYDSIPIAEIGLYNDQTLLITSYGMFAPEGYLTSYNSCIDCRLQGGTTTKPSFWE